MKQEKLTRSDALKQIVVLPALAGALIAGEALPAWAADNKKQFHYQNKPGKNGEKCSQCRFFKPPHSCSVVTGTISPNGWCTAWSKK
ncbi:MAG TPA: high-potential iron-sulfur protein [Candidatus Baltobacteraceae bacterium]|nr:high-potential iron-sulfur protein [Candidatus Baltobacteraceae bacterium]